MKKRRLTPPDATERLQELRPLDAPAPGHSARFGHSWMGPEAESLVADYLLSLGWRILERNFRNRRGEIDIIASDGELLVFVEVKARGQLLCGHPGESVTHAKRQRIQQTAEYYRAQTGFPPLRLFRFDVVTLTGPPDAFQLEHCRNAF